MLMLLNMQIHNTSADDEIVASEACRIVNRDRATIAADPGAMRCFKEMADLRADALRMINRPDRHFAGPCPTIKAYSRTGKSIECGKFLYAATDERSITCPACRQPVDVQRNRQRAWREGDRLTERILLKRLKDIEEPVSERQLYRWLRQRKLTPVGWLHKGVFVEHYIMRGDPRVFSLRAVRQLRAAELKAGKVETADATSEVEILHEMLQTESATEDQPVVSRAAGTSRARTDNRITVLSGELDPRRPLRSSLLSGSRPRLPRCGVGRTGWFHPTGS
ncbi:hypothetical protein E3G69_002842 [Mycobacteroides abscessus]|nr:hypothetical protein E3G69_002842 [Mycobacteroides abscessus]QOF48491.1 hypothetical protein E3G70_002840 [Mycobacteroides abscessus]